MSRRTFPRSPATVGPSLDDLATDAYKRFCRALDYYLDFGGDDAKQACEHAYLIWRNCENLLSFRRWAYDDAHDQLEATS
ncbi:MAG: hypothetical protein JWM55_227 [Acidimicrobiaceae bacterium]|nr:hypothetical protein [Acidimicrobiaceae bacterium]